MIQYKLRRSTRYLIIDDSATPPDISIHDLRWRQRKGGLLEIGHHFTITHGGQTIETRPQALVGTHCIGHDLDSIGILLIGGRNVGDPETPVDNFGSAQRVALFHLIFRLRQQYGPLPIMGQYEFKEHSLQRGPALDMADLREDFNAYIATGGMSEDA